VKVYQGISYITYILTEPIYKMSFDDGVNISVADIETCSSDLFYENSVTFYKGHKLTSVLNDKLNGKLR